MQYPIKYRRGQFCNCPLLYLKKQELRQHPRQRKIAVCDCIDRTCHNIFIIGGLQRKRNTGIEAAKVNRHFPVPAEGGIQIASTVQPHYSKIITIERACYHNLPVRLDDRISCRRILSSDNAEYFFTRAIKGGIKTSINTITRQGNRRNICSKIEFLSSRHDLTICLQGNS